jgi:hypothetical protein
LITVGSAASESDGGPDGRSGWFFLLDCALADANIDMATTVAKAGPSQSLFRGIIVYPFLIAWPGNGPRLLLLSGSLASRTLKSRDNKGSKTANDRGFPIAIVRFLSN